MELKEKKFVLGMSGGVDSSVSLYLLKKAGFDVIGVSLKYATWKKCKRENACCTQESFDNAARVCDYFDCKHEIIDVSAKFNKSVIDYFKSELKRSRTPSPCVFCNPRVKFDELIKYADKIGAKYIATGHYARIRKKERFELLRSSDKTKDQTYSLSFMTQRELSRWIFPVGSFQKSEISEMAENIEGLSFYKKIKQSQDFCFLGKDELNNFIEDEIRPKGGEIVDESGRQLGKHKGLAFYTIGQRKSIGLAGGPYYVTDKDTRENKLIVSTNEDLSFKKVVLISPYSLISGDMLLHKIKVTAKLRSTGEPANASLEPSKEGLKLFFEQPQFAPTPGQIAVFYQGEVCLGGGVINEDKDEPN